MTRLSKQARRRMVSPKRPKLSGPKTGPKEDNLKNGFKDRINSVQGSSAQQYFIGKVKIVNN